MPNVPIQIPPGMLLNTTEYDAMGRWVDGNWIRFWRGKPRPIGGWDVAQDGGVDAVLNGTGRSLHFWRDLSHNSWIAIGTPAALYVYDGSDLINISPVVNPVPPGPEEGGTGFGYGGGDYGAAAYGTARAFTNLTFDPGIWTFDNWGEELIACPNWYGAIYKWVPGTAAAVLIEPLTGTEVPQKVSGILVTNERHLVAIAAGEYSTTWKRNPWRIAWSTQENYAQWTPSVTNSAGDYQLQTAGDAVCGTKFREENLIWTKVDVHRMTYLGPPYYYGFKRLGDNAGIAGAQAFAVTNSFVIWVSRDAIIIYDGVVRELAPEVREYYKSKINTQFLPKTVVGHNPIFNEIWIFFVRVGESEVSDYIIWNYEENTWAVGQLSRSAWSEARVFNYPVAVEPFRDGANYFSRLILHEKGFLNKGLSRNNEIFIKSSPIELGVGDNLMVVRRFVQDAKSDESPPATSLELTFEYKLAPESITRTFGPVSAETTRGYTDVRFTGRQVALTFNQVVDADWSIGRYRLELVQGSGR